MFLSIYESNIGIDTGLLVSIIAILLVFVVLLIIIGCVELFHVLCKKTKTEEVKQVIPAAPKASSVKSTEIKDEDMMVAALIATIDYTSETKKDAKLVSIKQIN